jgi:hypothetical protein
MKKRAESHRGIGFHGRERLSLRFYSTPSINEGITYTAFGLPLSVFLMAGFFKAVSREVIEAAILDGANIYQVFSYHQGAYGWLGQGLSNPMSQCIR